MKKNFHDYNELSVLRTVVRLPWETQFLCTCSNSSAYFEVFIGMFSGGMWGNENRFITTGDWSPRQAEPLLTARLI